jgi:F-type H+-transporting ATPase subunit gamma
MPSLKDLRKRVATVRSTQKITKAMKMVAAARLRRAQEAAERARPYAAKLAETFGVVAAGIEPDAHPLLARREERRVDVLVLTSDRGLCGGYNANLLRMAHGFIRAEGREAAVVVVGRKGLEYFRRRGVRIVQQHVGVAATPVPQLTRELTGALTQRFVDGETDAVYLAYSRFRSAITQIPTVTPLLPIALPTSDATPPVDYIFEPDRAALLDMLLPRYVDAVVTQALLEATASELGARMTAMDNATTNASDMISRLTLVMNRVRQAAITKELMEIISGAEALKG